MRLRHTLLKDKSILLFQFEGKSNTKLTFGVKKKKFTALMMGKAFYWEVQNIRPKIEF